MNEGKFALPEGYDQSRITVQTAKYNGTVNKERKWETPVQLEDAEVTVIGDTVSVSGFSYKDNYVVDVNNNPQGKKLIVTIPGVEVQRGAFTGKKVFTNSADSGVYDDDTRVGQFPQPTVTLFQKSYALDYAAPVTVDSGYWGFSEIFHVATDLSAVAPEDYVTSLNEELFYGTVDVTVDGGSTSVTYKPTVQDWKVWTPSTCSAMIRRAIISGCG